MNRGTSIGCVLVLGMSALAGCASSPYSSEYRYSPRPVSVDMSAPDAPEQAKIRAMATIVGLRRAVDEQPASIDARLLIENNGSAPARFDPVTLSLVDATLSAFPNPIVEPSDAFTIAPGQSRTVNASFSLDDRSSYDLDGLNLRWSVTAGNHTLSHSATFSRRELPRPNYTDPFYYDPYHRWHYDNYYYLRPHRYHR